MDRLNPMEAWHAVMTGDVYYLDGRLWCPDCGTFCPCLCCLAVTLKQDHPGQGDVQG